MEKAMSERLTNADRNLGDAEHGESATAMPQRRTTIGYVSGAIIGAFLVVDFLTPSLLPPRPTSEWMFVAALGLCIGQVNLIATWAVLAPGNIVVRIPWSLLLGMLMWYTLILSNRASGGISAEGSVLLGCVLLTGVVVAQIPLWIAKQSSQDDRQFHLQHLLLGTFLLAVALSLLRLVFPSGASGLHGNLGELVVTLGVVVICNLLVTVPCIWGGLILSSSVVAAAWGWLTYCAILTLVEYLVLAGISGSRGPDGMRPLVYMYVMNIAQCVAVFGPLRGFRALGFRLLRLPAAGKAATDTTDSRKNDGDRII
jgi:hypothetical protein